MTALLSLLLFAPAARESAMALCNRLFDASERANAYVYARFPAPEGATGALALALAAGFGCCYFGAAFAVKCRWMALPPAVAAAFAQAYFGLSFPAWGNIALFFLLGLMAVQFSAPGKSVPAFAAAALCAVLLTAAVWPGVDEATETASESARDRLAFLTRQEENTAGEDAGGAMETRHMNARSLLTGEDEAEKSLEYRLLTVEEQQISQPRWIDYLKIALLLALSAAVVILPFLPFLFFEARRKKAREARRLFQAENPGEALCAMFRHTAAYLESGGFGGGNRPYRLWPYSWQNRLPEAYQRQYAACALLFEEAAYSEHPIAEEQREQMRKFLAETERIFFDEADWKEKLRLRYGKCLHE